MGEQPDLVAVKAYLLDLQERKSRYEHQCTHHAAPGCVITRCNRSNITPRYTLPDTTWHAPWRPSN